MGISTLLFAPITAARLAVRAAEDLHALAERVRREPDPLDEAWERIDALLAEMRGLAALIASAQRELVVAIELGRDIEAIGRHLVAGGRDLLAATQRIDARGAQLLDGGRDLVAASERIDARGAELVHGGQDLVAASERIDDRSAQVLGDAQQLAGISREVAAQLRVFRAALPRLLDGVETVEHLDGAVETVADTVEPLTDAVETVADTVEPLAGAAEGARRITKRLSRRPERR